MNSIENTSENTNVETSKNIRKFIYVDTNCNFPPIISEVRFKIKMIDLLGKNGKYSYDKISKDVYGELIDDPVAFAALVAYEYDPEHNYILNIEDGSFIRNGNDSDDDSSDDSDDDSDDDSSDDDSFILTKEEMNKIYCNYISGETFECVFSFVYAETDLTLSIEDAKEEFKKNMTEIFGEYNHDYNFRYLSEGEYDNPKNKDVLFAARVFYVCYSRIHYNSDDCVLNQYDDFNEYTANNIGCEHLIEYENYYCPLMLHYAKAR